MILFTILQIAPEIPKPNTNINVVFIVIAIIVVGLLGYLFYLDRKMSTIEKNK